MFNYKSSYHISVQSKRMAYNKNFWRNYLRELF